MPQLLRIAILMADFPLERIQELCGHYGQMFTSLLHKAKESLASKGESDLDIELNCTSWDVCREESYPILEDIDVVLISGSKANAFENLPWILKLTEFIRKLIYEQNRVKVIGVCFGHQIVGRAIGLPLGRNPHGWEFSVLPIKLTLAGKEILAVEKKDTLSLHQMHRDEIRCDPRKLPKGVYHLGQTDVCKLQGLYHKGKFVTVQAHPEYNEVAMSVLMEARMRMGLFTEDNYKDGMARSKLEHDGLLVAKSFLRFAVKG